MEERLTEKKESILENKKFQFVVRLLTALSFAIYTLYQVILMFAIEASRIGRAIAILCLAVITIASFFALSKKRKVLTACSVLLVIGLLLLFVVKLINIPGLFGALDFADPSTVLNCIVFVCSELAAVLLVFYLTLMRDEDTYYERRATIIMMPIVIVLFVACFVMECVLMIKYHVNIDLRTRYSLIARLLYYGGFIGTAFSMLMPAQIPEEKRSEAELVSLEEDNDEIDLVM